MRRAEPHTVGVGAQAAAHPVWRRVENGQKSDG